VVVVDDVNGDGKLDATVANSFSNNGAVLIGLATARSRRRTLMPVGAHTVSTDLGDLDGDGDVDWVLSSFGGGFWRIYTNDGTGHFTFDQEISAPSNPSCSILYDSDNDGDLDLALTDEIADLIVLMENESSRSLGRRARSLRRADHWHGDETLRPGRDRRRPGGRTRRDQRRRARQVRGDRRAIRRDRRRGPRTPGRYQARRCARRRWRSPA
jgi:hypothetical protein